MQGNGHDGIKRQPRSLGSRALELEKIAQQTSDPEFTIIFESMDEVAQIPRDRMTATAQTKWKSLPWQLAQTKASSAPEYG